jgi:hypothetical protein
MLDWIGCVFYAKEDMKFDREVGLYKLNPVYHSLKAPGFNP